MTCSTAASAPPTARRAAPRFSSWRPTRSESARSCRFRDVRYAGALATAPSAFVLTAAREGDTLRLSVTVRDALSSATAAADFHRYFIQMRGGFRVTGRLAGNAVADSGAGFFETWRKGGQAEGRKQTEGRKATD